MSRDPIIDEIREVRRKIEAECNDDADKYYEHLLDVQDKYKNRLVRREPQPALREQPPAI
jgi:hypothetical protein